MMPYIIILKVRKFHQSSVNSFGITGEKPVGGRHIVNRVKLEVQKNACLALIIQIMQLKQIF